MQFHNLELVKETEKAKLFKNLAGLEDMFPKSAIIEETPTDKGLINLETEDWTFLEDKFKVARCSNCKIISKNEKGTAFRVEQGDVSEWVPAFAINEQFEASDGTLDIEMKIDMASNKGFTFEIVS